MMNENKQRINNALPFINAFRTEGELDPLDDLPAGISGDPQECILARAFNCDCSVGLAGGGGRWWIRFASKDKAEQLAAIFDSHVTVVWPTKMHPEPSYRVVLPQEIGKIASQFDHLQLPSKYYERDAPP